ncbi:MAG: hypothetical protein ACRDKT_01580 [Actinomycetota bacterium]
MTFRHSLLGVILVVALFGGACSSDDDIGPMTIRALGGEVTLHRGSEVIKVTDTHDLQPQDVVVVKGRDGVAELELEAHREVSLNSLKGTARVRIRSTSTIEGQSGSLLANAPGEDMKVLFDDATASFSDGRFRLDRGFGASRAASYSANVTLSAPGEGRIAMRPLYEVDIAAGDLPDAASPYELTYDGWDEEYIGEVVNLTEDLDRLAIGFSRQLDGSRPPLDYFADLAGAAKVDFMRPFLRRAPADLLVGFTIATNDRDRSLERSFKQAFDLYDAGARWGVAATILEVRATPLLAQLSDLILGTQVLAGGGGGSPEFVIAVSEGSSGSAPGTGGDDETVITGSTGGGNGDGDGNGNGGGESDDCADFASCTVEDIEDELPPGPNSEPEPEPSPTSRDLDILDPPGIELIKGV